MCDAYFFRFSEFLFNFVFVNNLKLLKIMRTKNLCLLLAFLFSLPIVIEAKNKKIKRRINIEVKTTTRVPMDFDFTVQDVNNTLQIVFIGYLRDADLVITDAYGQAVCEEYGTDICDGKTIYVPDAEAYPYSLEITSPVMDVIGEITLEGG